MPRGVHHRFSFEEYLQVEEDSGIKHEFAAGSVYSMSGGTPENAGITANIARLLGNALEGKPCRVFSPDLRVRVEDTALNPKVLVEVLSPSTEDYDRGDKLGNYKQIPSLEEVMLVAHDRREVEIVRREADGSWSRHIARDGDAARLLSVDCELQVAEIYRDPLAAA